MSFLTQATADECLNPDHYMFKCALCKKVVFSRLRRLCVEAQAEHKGETGHDISMIRGKLLRVSAPENGGKDK